jgi:PAS domain S-box-containing protein
VAQTEADRHSAHRSPAPAETSAPADPRNEEATAKLGEIADRLPQIVFQLLWSGGERRFTGISAGVQTAIGVSREAALRDASAVFAAVVPEDREGLYASLDAASGSLRRWAHEYRVRDASGLVRWVRGEALPDLRPDGKLFWNGYWQDVTAHRTRDEAQARALEEFQSLLAAAPAALAVIRDRVIVRCNQAMTRLFGYETGELNGASMRVLFADDESYEWNTRRDHLALSRSKVVRHEQEFVRKDGERFTALIAACATSPDSQEIVLSVTDITVQIELAQALAQAKEAADSANRAKSAFLATMSHEIRTPMNAALGMLELLSLSTLLPEQRAMVDEIQYSANTLLRLIDDILDFSRVEAGQLEVRPEPVSLRDVARQAIAAHASHAARKMLSVRLEVADTLSDGHVADALRILQILSNLLGNAIKFTKAGGHIAVRIGAPERADGRERVRFAVSDSGIGIAPEDLERMFAPFVQLEGGGGRRLGGAGLGLSICKRLVAAMGGGIEVESEPGRGTTIAFELNLPLAPADAILAKPWRRTSAGSPEGAPQSAAPAQTSRGPKVLIVEDHPASLKLLLMQAAMLGYQADGATDGFEALEKWKAGSYAAIVTDCQMPRMDGFQLAREIRRLEGERPQATPIPIIACTANAFEGDVKECFAAGMTDFLSKPLRLEDFGRKLMAATGVAPAAAPQQPPPVSEPSDDLKELSEFTGGDRTSEIDILKQLISANNGDLARLERAIESKDASEIARAAHRLKGAPRMIGARVLAEAAERLEQCAKQGDIARLGELAESLRAANSAFRRRLRERLDSYTTADGTR